MKVKAISRKLCLRKEDAKEGKLLRRSKLLRKKLLETIYI
jgi:hypothetical protein